MNTYIALDLEWNQSEDGKSGRVPGLPFEIIEIGAVKLDAQLNPLSEFHCVIKPKIYKRLHFRVSEVINIGIEELKKKGGDFEKLGREFLDWCFRFDEEGNPQEKPMFCTWGEADLTQLQRNMKYYGIENPFPYPFLYYDVQKLYALMTNGEKRPVVTLNKAVESLGIREDNEYHRALEDAQYTAKVMQKMDMLKFRDYLSLDYFRIPRTEDEEIYLVFPDYSKYVSRAFPGKEAGMKEKRVTDMICYQCSRMLKKPVPWFPVNQKQYLCLGYCPKHGFARGKLRIKNTSDGKIYFVKTTRLVDGDTAEEVQEKRKEARKKNR